MKVWFRKHTDSDSDGDDDAADTEAAPEDAESGGNFSSGDAGAMRQRGQRNNNASYAASRAKLMKSASTGP